MPMVFPYVFRTRIANWSEESWTTGRPCPVVAKEVVKRCPGPACVSIGYSI